MKKKSILFIAIISIISCKDTIEKEKINSTELIAKIKVNKEITKPIVVNYNFDKDFILGKFN